VRSFVAVFAALCSMKRLGKWLAIYVAVMFAAPWLALSALTPDQIEQGYQRLTLVAIPSAVVLDGMIAFGVFALVLWRVRRRLATILTSPLRFSNSDSASRRVAVGQGWRNLPGIGASKRPASYADLPTFCAQEHAAAKGDAALKDVTMD